MKHKAAILTALLTATGLSLSNGWALIASDTADNYGGSWATGSGGGTGFSTWTIVSNDGGGNFAGAFIGSSAPAAGDINTGGVSFGLYANPGTAFVNANRSFSSAMTQGDVFTLDIGVNFDNGNKGFSLFTGGAGGTEIFNFNVGGGAQINAAGGLTITPGTGAGYDYGGPAKITLSLAYTGPTTLTYSVSRISSQGNQGLLFSGTVGGNFSAPDSFRLYNSGTDAGGAAQNNLYVNNLQVVPESKTALLFVAGIALLTIRARMRRLM